MCGDRAKPMGFAFIAIRDPAPSFGMLPTLYAIFLAFTKRGAFVGLDNFVKVLNDYRFRPALEHVGLYL